MKTRLTVTQKLVIGTATLLTVAVLGRIAMVLGLYTTYEVVDQLAGKQEALTAVAFELEVNVTDVAADAGRYLAVGGQQFRNEFARHAVEFLAFMDQFDRLADAPRLKAHGARLRSLFADLRTTGLRVMDGHDRQAALLATAVDDFDQFKRLLRTLHTTIVEGEPSSGESNAPVHDLETQWADMEKWLGYGLRPPAWGDRDRLDDHLDRAEALLRHLARLPAIARQARLVAALRQCGQRFRRQLEAAVDCAVQFDNDRRQFVTLRGTIDDLLNNQLQPEADEARRALHLAAKSGLQRTIQLSSLPVPIALVVGLASVLWVVISIRRPIAALTEAASALGRGDMDYRVQLSGTDEFGTLAAAFNGMAARIQASQEELQALWSRIEALRETERKAISREIHDDLGQTLTAIKISASRLDGLCVREAAHECQDMLALREELIGLVDSAISTTRRVASGLRPGVLDHLGLAAAVEWQATTVQQQTGIVCELHATDIEPPLDDERATACFRIVQEALTNAARHSEATHVSVRIDSRPETLVLEIVDNGKGISDERLSGVHSLGLVGMRERAQAFGGWMKVERVDTGGTRVLVEIPRQPPTVTGSKSD